VRAYLDSALLIYLVENISPYVDYLGERLSSEDTHQVCSDLSRLECRVQPLQQNKTVLLEAFDVYFAEIISETVPLSRTVIDLATEVRARYGFKTPDAIHIACAIVAECDLFLTNDKQLERCREIVVEVIGD
jgi:uncharacterized protein